MAKKKNISKRASLKQRRQAERARAARNKKLRWAGIATLVVLTIGAVAYWRSASAEPVNNPAEVMAANTIGPTDAPVQIVEFGDLGCPACRAWHNAGIREQILAKYGDRISITFRHFPVITPQSPQAAEASQCAAEQGAFWEYHDYIYEQTPQGALSVTDLQSYAAAIGLDTNAFNNCMSSGKYREYVARDQQAAFSNGARGTPSFYINGQAVYYPGFEDLAVAIDGVLSQ
ncbi:MAG: DsbA family protein [Anaerolineae bacterium]